MNLQEAGALPPLPPGEVGEAGALLPDDPPPEAGEVGALPPDDSPPEVGGVGLEEAEAASPSGLAGGDMAAWMSKQDGLFNSISLPLSTSKAGGG